jgi:hypothetical protein
MTRFHDAVGGSISVHVSIWLTFVLLHSYRIDIRVAARGIPHVPREARVSSLFPADNLAAINRCDLCQLLHVVCLFVKRQYSVAFFHRCLWPSFFPIDGHMYIERTCIALTFHYFLCTSDCRFRVLVFYTNTRFSPVETVESKCRSLLAFLCT